MLTLLASPKVGPRLYFGSVAFACSALAGWIVPQLVTRWSRITAGVLAAVAWAFVSWHVVGAYHEAGPEFTARLEALRHAPQNSVLELPRYTVKRSRWFLGDDLEVDQIRNMVSFSFGLALVKMTGPGPTMPPPPDDP